jgi:hypothetical protein
VTVVDSQGLPNVMAGLDPAIHVLP